MMKTKYFIAICGEFDNGSIITNYKILQKYVSKDDKYIIGDIASNLDKYISKLDMISHFIVDNEYREYLEDDDMEYIMPGYHEFDVASKVAASSHMYCRDKLTVPQVCAIMKPHYENDLAKFQQCLENMPSEEPEIKFMIVDNLEKLYDMGFNTLKRDSIY